ncbi:4-alpha-glucanotransferase [Parenemella sanctibonifatiensis]|uniref:4-alpha-glucanotransferase n=1 Tax=Parenemella sanctibonifatiensis TaxID=2016505 RepID=UPI0026A97723
MNESPAGPDSVPQPPSTELRKLADAYGIATQFHDWKGNERAVSAETLIRVLAAMGINATSSEAIAEALVESETRLWRRVVPPFTVMTETDSDVVAIHVPHGAGVHVELRTEGGETRALVQLDLWRDPREVDGQLIGEASFELPAGLPLGYHKLTAHWGDQSATGVLAVTPATLPEPALTDGRGWGFAAQLYSVLSRRSWGLGDLSDLADLTTWSGAEGADFLLVNPLHAAEPSAPMENSPYLPTSRRFINPIYLRPEAIEEYAYLSDADRVEVDQLRAGVPRIGGPDDLLDRNLTWAAKQLALRTIFAAGRTPARQIAFEQYCNREGAGLLNHAIWSALVVEHGMGWRDWPADLQDPRSEAVADFSRDHAAEVEFWCWLQWQCDLQLARAQTAATEARMSIGVIHDLAVGVSVNGSDVWSEPEAYAVGVTVGSPPDAFNQKGQDWSQPPLRPDRLEELAYRPFRTMVAGLLRHGGGLRMDHVMALFRLWWVPQGRTPDHGTYVRYDPAAMVGILVLEAARAGAIVVGEDLGTVEPGVREYLSSRGVSGTSLLWFEYDGDTPLPPEQWRADSMASITTHDLPTTPAYLANSHVQLRHDLGLLDRPLAEELAEESAHVNQILDAVGQRGLLPDEPDETSLVEAMHRYLALSPARYLCPTLSDAVGDHRPQNLPGTWQEYPNWRVPLAGPDGVPVLLEDLVSNPRARRLMDVMRERRD